MFFFAYEEQMYIELFSRKLFQLFLVQIISAQAGFPIVRNKKITHLYSLKKTTRRELILLTSHYASRRPQRDTSILHGGEFGSFFTINLGFHKFLASSWWNKGRNLAKRRESRFRIQALSLEDIWKLEFSMAWRDRFDLYNETRLYELKCFLLVCKIYQ